MCNYCIRYGALKSSGESRLLMQHNNYIEENCLSSERGVALLFAFIRGKKVAFVPDNNISELFVRELLRTMIANERGVAQFVFKWMSAF